MKEIKNKFLSIFLSLTMVLTMIPMGSVTVFADTKWVEFSGHEKHFWYDKELITRVDDGNNIYFSCSSSHLGPKAVYYEGSWIEWNLCEHITTTDPTIPTFPELSAHAECYHSDAVAHFYATGNTFEKSGDTNVEGRSFVDQNTYDYYEGCSNVSTAPSINSFFDGIYSEGWYWFDTTVNRYKPCVAPAHTHGSWDYEVENTSTLKATCGNEGCDDPSYSVSLTLLASGTNYSGIEGLDAFNTATGRTGENAISASNVKFYQVETADTTEGGTPVEGTLSEEGYYYAALEITGITPVAKKAFTIGHPSWPTAIHTEGCGNPTSVHFYFTGNTFNDDTAGTCVEGRMYAYSGKAGWIYQDYDEANESSQLTLSTFPEGATEGWYYDEEETFKVCMPPHTWGYSVSSDGATLTATCKKECGAETAHTATLTLTASDTNYTGINATELASFNEATGLNISESNVKFYTVTTEGATTGGTNETSTAPTANGNYYASLTVEGATAVKAFKIVTPVTNVKLDTYGTTLIIGNTKTLVATVNPSNASNKTVTWSTSNENVATVDQTGTVTAVSTGYATITVTTEDGNKYATCKITVIPVSLSSKNHSDCGLSSAHHFYSTGKTYSYKGATAIEGAFFHTQVDYGDLVCQDSPLAYDAFVFGADEFKNNDYSEGWYYYDDADELFYKCVPSLEWDDVSDDVTGYYNYSNGDYYFLVNNGKISQVVSGAITDDLSSISFIRQNDNGITVKGKSQKGFNYSLDFEVGSEGPVSVTVKQYYSNPFKFDFIDDANYSYKDNVLTISGTGTLAQRTVNFGLALYPNATKVVVSGYETIKENAFYYKQTIESIVLSDSVTAIGDNAFYDCTLLEEIKLGNGLETIGNQAFIGTSLTEITIPNSVKTIGNYAFYECATLQKVNLGNGLETIGQEAFEETALTEITIPDSVTTLDIGAFYKCASLESVKLGKGIDKIADYMFYGCSKLESIELGNNIKSVGSYAFYDCFALEGIKLGNNIKSIGVSAFEGSGLKEVTIPDSVTTIGNSAFSFTALKDVTIPASVETIDDYAFYNCKSLENVILGSNVNTIGVWAFGNTKLSEITIPASVVNTKNYAFGYSWDGNDTTAVTPFVIKGHGTGNNCSPYLYFKNFKKQGSWKYINLDAKPTETDNISVSGLNTTLSFTTNEAKDSVLHIDGIEIKDLYNYVSTETTYTGEGIYITRDGDPVDREGNYEVTEGSVKVTFSKDFLNSLSVGSHTIKTYINGTEAAAADNYDYVFTTIIAVTPKPSTGGGSTTPTTTPTYKVPNTSVGQDINPMNKTIGLLSIALVAGCVVRKKKED